MPNLTKTNHKSILNPTEMRYLADKFEGKKLKRGISTTQIKENLAEKASNIPLLIGNFFADIEILHNYAQEETKMGNIIDYELGDNEKMKAAEYPLYFTLVAGAITMILKNPLSDSEKEELISSLKSLIEIIEKT